MAKATYIATVQILISPDENLESDAQACDWISGLLTDNDKILDWSYLKVGGQFLDPQEITIPNNYEEGFVF